MGLYFISLSAICNVLVFLSFLIFGSCAYQQRAVWFTVSEHLSHKQSSNLFLFI